MSETLVRLALPMEAPAIAEVQRATWAVHPWLSGTLDQWDVGDATQIWHQAIIAPPLAHYRVLVALEGDQVCGFVVVGPSSDEDASETDSEIHEFAIAPNARGKGHGSRLMNAAVDTMQKDGYERATWWVLSQDDELRSFIQAAGWAPDGAHRELGTEDPEVRVKQVRLHTDISASVEADGALDT